MTRSGWRQSPYVILSFLLSLPLISSLTLPAAAQGGRAASAAPWSAPLRGSWVQTGRPVAGDVVLAGSGDSSEIVVGAKEDLNVRQAATFLAGDIQKISGFRPPIVTTPTGGNRVSIRLVTLGRGQVPSTVDTRNMRGQWEAYRVVTAPRTVWLVGSNSRGTAFAAYTLSERLGIDPLYIWTGYVPEHHDPLVLEATQFAQGPPTVKYRGFFHDDEDILPRPFDQRGYPSQTGDVPLEWYERFFETALRLRMNMVAPYTRAHRRLEVQQLASAWGLFYTSHHYDILVSNPFGLERFNLAQERGVRPVYDWFTNKEGMLTFWRGGVLENRNLDVIWPVGMRATSDRGYTWPEGTTDDEKAKTFHEVISDQVNMVKELLPPDKTPIFHFTMYTEMLPQYEAHTAEFDLPSDVIIVWPDDNDGHMRGLPKTLGKWKHGVYYHLAYLGGFLSKQTTHVVAPSTIATEFHKIVDAGATEFMLVNMSETREYVMGARMIADICWNAPGALGQTDPADRFVSWWSNEYFGAKAADAAHRVYNQYYALLDGPPELWRASNVVQSIIVDQLQKRVAGESYEPVNADTVVMLQSRVAKLDAAVAEAERAEGQMSAAQAQYFEENAVLGLKIDDYTTQAALKLAAAAQASSTDEMWTLAREARPPLEQLEAEFAWAEHPPFDRWYHETWIRSGQSFNNPHRPYNELRQFLTSEGRDPVVIRRFFRRPPRPPASQRRPGGDTGN